jgi:hypothetical protein
MGWREQDDGAVHAPDAMTLARLADDRRNDLERALAMIKPGRRAPRVLHVGTRDGRWLASVGRRLHVNAVALEPWLPWANEARMQGLRVHAAVIETWRTRAQFDVIAEHDLLPMLADPLAHLRSIAARLAPGGVALIEVPNLLRAVGVSTENVLCLDRAHWFTPRALVAMCRRAGLVVAAITNDERIRVWCHAGPASACVPPGPDADDVAQCVWGNDLRLQLKRALAQVGGGPGALVAAAEVHRHCTRAAIRADLAIEIANACERNGDFDGAAAWLSTSLADRPDPDVEVVARHLAAVRARVVDVWRRTPAANDPGTTQLAM